MKPVKYVVEDKFELTVHSDCAIYVDRNGEAKITCSIDGGAFDGEHTSFESLYSILFSRPELRIASDRSGIAAYFEGRDDCFLVDAPDVIGKIAQISDWLGITAPQYRM